jgi:hypothetical protein
MEVILLITLQNGGRGWHHGSHNRGGEEAVHAFLDRSSAEFDPIAFNSCGTDAPKIVTLRLLV